MFKNKIHSVTIILKSCLTGKAVWIYRGASKNAARKQYWKACHHEMERMKRWTEQAAQRKENIMRILTELTDGMPAISELPPEKKQLARQLLALSEKSLPAGGAFYEHIMEERRRREEDRRIRRQMREREKQQNRDYDKSGKG